MGRIPERRTVIIGDVHGMRAELEHLLEEVSPVAGDHVVLVGDLIRKGPDSLGVFRVLGELRDGGIRVDFVLGNHEWKVWRAIHGDGKASWSVRELIAYLPADALEWLEHAPVHLEIPEHGARVVHGGILPGWTELPPEDVREAYERDPERLRQLLRLRHVGGPDHTNPGEFLRLGTHGPDTLLNATPVNGP